MILINGNDHLWLVEGPDTTSSLLMKQDVMRRLLREWRRALRHEDFVALCYIYDQTIFNELMRTTVSLSYEDAQLHNGYGGSPMITAQLDVSRRQFNRVLKRLEAEGAIFVQHRRLKGKSCYLVTPDTEWVPPPTIEILTVIETTN